MVHEWSHLECHSRFKALRRRKRTSGLSEVLTANEQVRQSLHGDRQQTSVHIPILLLSHILKEAVILIPGAGLWSEVLLSHILKKSVILIPGAGVWSEVLLSHILKESVILIPGAGVWSEVLLSNILNRGCSFLRKTNRNCAVPAF
ncbi:hypothetical protein AVEN_172675-1 [Araneus ventricosus]|uniref:Uncharacterized protein n=1 Tax=Araneus ventricosus TaxID=182803 RepID=A0A4Y2L3S9_ARAVE|nr:hypothetical protein AVEN_172675-1 [Araneus ventricosus]